MHVPREETAVSHDWHELTDLVGERRFSVTKVRIESSGIEIEGDFELPPLANLTYEDQVFVSAFVRSHGSIKEMEKAFGISYPTVKNRLNRIGALLPLAVTVETPAPVSDEDVLGMLERGEISAAEAEARLRR